jgi:hypothetical protein
VVTHEKYSDVKDARKKVEKIFQLVHCVDSLNC